MDNCRQAVGVDVVLKSKVVCAWDENQKAGAVALRSDSLD
jgi:hypothetical protein